MALKYFINNMSEIKEKIEEGKRPKIKKAVVFAFWPKFFLKNLKAYL